MVYVVESRRRSHDLGAWLRLVGEICVYPKDEGPAGPVLGMSEDAPVLYLHPQLQLCLEVKETGAEESDAFILKSVFYLFKL